MFSSSRKPSFSERVYVTVNLICLPGFACRGDDQQGMDTDFRTDLVQKV